MTSAVNYPPIMHTRPSNPHHGEQYTQDEWTFAYKNKQWKVKNCYLEGVVFNSDHDYVYTFNAKPINKEIKSVLIPEYSYELHITQNEDLKPIIEIRRKKEDDWAVLSYSAHDQSFSYTHPTSSQKFRLDYQTGKEIQIGEESSTSHTNPIEQDVQPIEKTHKQYSKFKIEIISLIVGLILTSVTTLFIGLTAATFLSKEFFYVCIGTGVISFVSLCLGLFFIWKDKVETQKLYPFYQI